MELKVICNWGQKYKFDVEPVNCPACGADGTPAANALIPQPVVSPPIAPPPRPRTAMPSPAAPVRPLPTARPPTAAAKKPPVEFSLWQGTLGAFLGAGLGAILLIACAMGLGFLPPFSGLIVGVLAGCGARWFFKGTDNTLGLIAAAFALLFLGGTLVFLVGPTAIGSIISLVVCVVIAWRISSG